MRSQLLLLLKFLAIYVDGTYYVATTTNTNEDENKFPIHASKDLVTWKQVGHIFPKGHIPKWAVQDFWVQTYHITREIVLAIQWFC
jgi:hypothetical protein